MCYGIVSIIYGIPLTEAAAEKINEWEEDENSPWFENNKGACGFVNLYSASGPYQLGYAGVELCTLESYGQDQVSKYRMVPTDAEKQKQKSSLTKFLPSFEH